MLQILIETTPKYSADGTLKSDDNYTPLNQEYETSYQPQAITFTYKYVSEYLKLRKAVTKFFKSNPNGKVVVSWDGESLNQQQWRKSCLDALHRRINLKGNYFCPSGCTDRDSDLRKDVEVINAWFDGKRKTQWGRNLSSKWMRERYPNLVREMREYDNQNM